MSQEPMPNSVVKPKLRHDDSVAFAMWLSTAVGTTTFYCVAHRLQIVESPNLTIRAFLRLQKSEMRAINRHSH